ncbi:MAG: hypothetical protein INR71_12145, partial [Terriglobus roseus]|nr:hypothetical protein [Terriglobus roseus]
MLRPATPLAVLFFAAFVLLLLSTLSTPIIKAIPLASWHGTTYGVFGYCNSTSCSDIAIGYSFQGLTEGSSPEDYNLPTTTRHSLSSILIVHPVAAFLCLVCFALAVAAHFHGPSHSPRYLLALLIFTIPTVLVTLLAFLVDILVFVPHVQWGGWIVLGATIIILANMVLTCAMRRTLVSRKARKKRIAENAEMSGENYYAQRAQVDMGMSSGPASSYGVMTELPKADSPPPMPMHDMSPSNDRSPEFATFDLQKKNSDDRAPLNPGSDSPGRSRSRSAGGGWRAPDSRYDSPSRRGPPGDPFGNPNAMVADPYGAPMGMAGGARGPPHVRSGSMSSNGSQRGGYGGPPPFGSRGRGGYPPNRGGYPPRGGFGRGGYRGGPNGYGGPGRGGP